METATPRIIIAGHDQAERELVLNKEKTAIGRAPQNDIVIDDLAISGEHAVIAIRHGEVVLEDLDSTNGTKINGQPVKKHFLQDGDVIELGHSTIRYKRSIG